MTDNSKVTSKYIVYCKKPNYYIFKSALNYKVNEKFMDTKKFLRLFFLTANAFDGKRLRNLQLLQNHFC